MLTILLNAFLGPTYMSVNTKKKIWKSILQILKWGLTSGEREEELDNLGVWSKGTSALAFFFFFFYGHTCDIRKFLGLNWSCSCPPQLLPTARVTLDPSCICHYDTGSLTHRARLELELASPQTLCQVLLLLSYNGNSDFTFISNVILIFTKWLYLVILM